MDFTQACHFCPWGLCGQGNKFSPHPPINTAGILLLFNSTAHNCRYCAKEERMPVYLSEQKTKALFSLLTWYCCLHMSKIWGLFRKLIISTDSFNCIVVFPNDIPVLLQILVNLIKVSDFYCSYCLVLFFRQFFFSFSLMYYSQVGLTDFIFNLSQNDITSITSNRMFIKRYYQCWMTQEWKWAGRRRSEFNLGLFKWAKPAEMLWVFDRCVKTVLIIFLWILILHCTILIV